MADAVNIAVAGLNGAAARVANDASNIVNASSTPLSPQKSENDSGLVPQDIVTISATATNGENPSSAQANTDLASSIVDMNAAQVNYGADAAVIKTAEKMQKSLLDIVA